MQTIRFKYIFICSVITILFFSAYVTYAESDEPAIEDLKTKIDDRTSKIRALEKEIEKYEEELVTVGEEKSSLENAIKTLDISQNKIEAEQNITENKISATTFQISKLALEIQDKEKRIDLHTQTLAQSIREINEVDDHTFIETMLASGNFSDVWDQVETLQRFQQNVQANLTELKGLKEELESSKDEREARRRELINYNSDLDEQGRAIDITKDEKSTLLTKTKNKESNYLSIVEEKKAARAEFEQELLEFESQLKIAIDPSSLPDERAGLLSWPLDNVYVTQYFGNTAFAQSGAYNGQGHNGVDFRASPGTRIKTVLSGTVMATGNTDAIPGCYSYGKWMLVRHNNGLSSLYAHLSHIAVGEGTNVVTGQTIGYSGATGYATGPHLHLTLFATQGVQIVRMGDIKKITNCADASIPVAPHEAYLNPLAYLPEYKTGD